MKNRSAADAPDLARRSVSRKPQERAGVRSVVGAQTDERIEIGRADVAGRLAELESEAREQSRRAIEVEAEARNPRPVVYTKGRQAPPGPADGRTNRPA
jgi:hypothetical protein